MHDFVQRETDTMRIQMTAAVVAMVAGVAAAQSLPIRFSGDTTGGPTYTRPGGTGTFSYQAFTFTVPTTQAYEVFSGAQSYDGWIYLYQGSFDAANPGANLIGDSDDFSGNRQSLISGANLSSGTTYVIVQTSFSAGDAGTFTINIDTVLPLPQPGIVVAPTPVLPTRQPNLVDENGLDYFGNVPALPGAFPDRVVSGRWDSVVATDAAPDGFGLASYEVDSDESEYNMFRSIKSGPAPFYWTGGATNEGDVDANIGANPEVFNRAGGLYAQPIGRNWLPETVVFSNNGFRFQSLGRDDAFDIGLGDPNYGWAAGFEAGVVFVMTAENGVDVGSEFFGVPTGTLYGVAGASFGGRAGKGYSMVDGRIAGIFGGETSARTSTYLGGGAAGVVSEHNHDLATIWFSFAEGWHAGLLEDNLSWKRETAPGALGGIACRSPWLGSPANSNAADATELVTDLTPGRMHGFLNLGSIRNPENGMLFTVNSNSNQRAIVNVLEKPAPSSKGVGLDGWEYLGHTDDVAYPDASGNTGGFATTGENSSEWATLDGGDFALGFVYLDYDTENLIGGKIDADGEIVRAAGTGLSVTKMGTGRYMVTIAGDTDEGGVLMLQGLNDIRTNASLPGRTFLSYEWTGTGYMVEARETVFDAAAPLQEGYELVDSPFYVAYISFTNPPATSLADVDGNAQLDIFDILGFFDFFGVGNLAADVNGDGITDIFDILDFFTIFGS